MVRRALLVRQVPWAPRVLLVPRALRGLLEQMEQVLVKL